MVLVAIGLALGLAAAFMLSRLIASILFGVQVHDVFAYLGTAVLFVSAAVVACHLPARRATRVDPMVVLRAE
jgi:putative ABC transport system permease protein